jgi:hypothetical protein
MTRRPGISLTEILVALFIMALGTIAILTMFPMGLITMGQALKDDRATQCAHQADAYMRWYWKEFCMTKKDNFPDFMNTPDGKGGAIIAKLDMNVTKASYPILVDPMGFAIGRTYPNWMGDNGQGSGIDQTNIPRRNLSLISNSPPAVQASMALRTTSLLDTLGYNESGQALTGADMRTLPYNWAWMLQRPNNSDQFTVDCKVLVYDKRVHQFAPSASEKVFPPVAAAVGQTVVSFDATNAPPVQKGGWILDATITNIDPSSGNHFPPATSGNPSGAQPGVRNANFYRVVSVTLNGAVVNIELQTALKADSGTAPTAGLPANLRRFVVLNGIYEVFDLPPLTSSGN